MKVVDSSLLSAVGYFDGNLVARFKDSGAVYLYKGVPMRVYVELTEADSVGRYFLHNIKDLYVYVKLTD